MLCLFVFVGTLFKRQCKEVPVHEIRYTQRQGACMSVRVRIPYVSEKTKVGPPQVHIALAMTPDLVEEPGSSGAVHILESWKYMFHTL